jgi:hypothetical protein
MNEINRQSQVASTSVHVLGSRLFVLSSSPLLIDSTHKNVTNVATAGLRFTENGFSSSPEHHQDF